MRDLTERGKAATSPQPFLILDPPLHSQETSRSAQATPRIVAEDRVKDSEAGDPDSICSELQDSRRANALLRRENDSLKRQIEELRGSDEKPYPIKQYLSQRQHGFDEQKVNEIVAHLQNAEAAFGKLFDYRNRMQVQYCTSDDQTVQNISRKRCLASFNMR